MLFRPSFLTFVLSFILSFILSSFFSFLIFLFILLLPSVSFQPFCLSCFLPVAFLPVSFFFSVSSLISSFSLLYIPPSFFPDFHSLTFSFFFYSPSISIYTFVPSCCKSSVLPFTFFLLSLYFSSFPDSGEFVSLHSFFFSSVIPSSFFYTLNPLQHSFICLGIFRFFLHYLFSFIYIFLSSYLASYFFLSPCKLLFFSPLLPKCHCSLLLFFLLLIPPSFNLYSFFSFSIFSFFQPASFPFFTSTSSFLAGRVEEIRKIITF